MPSNIDNKQLCLNLLYAESEQEVISILKNAGYWGDETAWCDFGNNENNWSIIGNQQGHPVAAMVEKLVNSIDAVLMRECQARGIPLESPEAPQSIPDALEQFFGIKKGNLANIGANKRSDLAQNIGLIATGALGRSKQNPNYTVFDRGEGQTPRDMPKTLLSLSQSNKLRIPFVQGKFNMGGTGVLRHGGTYRLQLVISRRCPQIADSNDPTSPHWGFTIVRRQNPPQGARNSVFTYLSPGKDILTFQSDRIRMPHNHRYSSRAPEIDWGTAIKLYEYNMKGYQSNIKLDLYYSISLRLPQPGLPIRFYEFRHSRQSNPEATMAGLLVRLEDDRGDNVEDGFPIPYRTHVEGEPLRVYIYAFKKNSDKNFRKDEGIVFTINGQAHGSLSKRFFSRQRVKMDYIKDSLLVIVDATEISAQAREDLFMNSRDRLSEGDLRTKIEENLERIIRDDSLLKQLRDERRREAIANKISDSKPLKDILENIFKNSPSLEALFITGKALSNPFKSVAANIKEEAFNGEFYPTYFRLMKKFQKLNERPINRDRIRIQFETDAVNDYFAREDGPGEFELKCNGRNVRDYDGPNLLNGVATLNIALPETAEVGDRLPYRAIVKDNDLNEPFINQFEVLVTDPVNESKSKPGDRQPPAADGEGERSLPDSLAMLNIVEVREDEWEDYDFNRESALSVIATSEGSHDYYINMDNVYLNTELKALKANDDPKLIQSKFKYAMVLIGMMILKGSDKHTDNPSDETMTPEEAVYKFTSMVAPVILPMIDSLGDLKLDD